MFLHYFYDKENINGHIANWGWSNWKGMKKTVELIRASDNSDVFRSSYLKAPKSTYASVIEPVFEAPTVVQYMLEIEFTDLAGDKRTNTLARGEWELPYWYRPVDHNALPGRDFSAFTILDNVAPGRAWINELNVYDGSSSAGYRYGETNQYIEVAVPHGQDLTGWSVRYVPNDLSYTNTMFKFGENIGSGTVASKKTDHFDDESKYVFMAVQSPKTLSAGGIRYADGKGEDGEESASGVWYRAAQGDTTGVIDDRSAFSLQLVRASGVIEHEIVAVGTNIWIGTRFEAQGSPTNLLNKIKSAYPQQFTNPQTSVVYIGTEADGTPLPSLSVINSNGVFIANWTNNIVCTPGWINEGQQITPGWAIRASGAMVLVTTKLGDGNMSYKIGDTVYREDALTPINTNETLAITYFPDKWYETASVTTNGIAAVVDADGNALAGQLGGTTIKVGGTNDIVVVGYSRPETRLITTYGLTESNPYTKAVMAWLSGGVRLGGDEWKNGDLADIGYYGMNGEFVTNLTLTACYWFDMDPTDPQWALTGGMSSAPVLMPETSVTNLNIDVYLAFTNLTSGARERLYTLRGKAPGENSLNWGGQSVWTSVTFKVEGRLGLGNLDYSPWRPLRWFVFDAGSFDPATYTSTIQVKDPFDPNAGFGGWQSYTNCPVFFRWNVNDEMPALMPDTLRPESLLYK